MTPATEFENVPCPLCGNTQAKQLATTGQYGLPCRVAICPLDGMVYINSRWPKSRYDHFYQHEYDSYYRPAVLADEHDEKKYAKVKTLCSRLQHLELLEQRQSVLDIGAGMGWALQWLKSNYADFQRFYAIESSNHCVKNIKEVVGANVIATDVDAPWSDSNYDLVIMRHVLEHFMDPVEVLVKVRDKLSDTGIIYIAVPDMMHPRKSINNYWFRCVHTYYFSAATLRGIATKAGLKPIVIENSGSELWGVFQASDAVEAPSVDSDFYQQQRKVIQRQRLKSIYPDFKKAIKKIFSS